MCPAFHCVVMPCDYRLAALLFTDSSPTCTPVINFKYTSHHLTAFQTVPTRHALYHHLSNRIPVKQMHIIEFINLLSFYVSHGMTSSNNE
jgi:hypothetical protein